MSASRPPYPDRGTLLKILHHMYDELFVINGDGVILYVNQACERHYGVKPEEMIGKTVAECTQKGYWYPPISPIALKTQKTATYEQTTNTGRKLLATVTPVFDREGNLEMVVENLRDIPKLEEIKNDLKATRRLLLRYKQEVQNLRDEELYYDFVAHSKPIREVLHLSRKIADVDPSVLIVGETGTGKGVLAKYIHRTGSRKNGPFITVNCAAVPDQLLESELYGYAPGAFTGADPRGKMGLVELADGGTLFLDEIADIPLHLQAKLLQMLQERKFIAVGGTRYRTVNCRILSATNRNIHELMKSDGFRKDLYYRLNTIEIKVPPLRERKEDIFPLIQFFLNKFCGRYKKERKFSEEAISVMTGYSWPGNVRELENMVERLIITTQAPIISLENLPLSLTTKRNPLSGPARKKGSLDEALLAVERDLVLEARKNWGSSYKVARALNISQPRAYRLMKKHGAIKPQNESAI